MFKVMMVVLSLFKLHVRTVQGLTQITVVDNIIVKGNGVVCCSYALMLSKV